MQKIIANFESTIISSQNKEIATTGKGLYKLAIVCETMGCGGAENFIIKLCRRLNKDLFSITVALVVRDAPYGHILLNKLNTIPKVESFVSPYHKNDPRTIIWLGKLWKNYKFDIVHSFLARADIICGLITMLNGFKNLIISERGDRKNGVKYDDGVNNRKWRLRRWSDRNIVFPVAKKAIANSEFGRMALISAGMDKDRILVIPNGIEIRKNVSIKKKDYLPIHLCIVANLLPIKGHAYLLNSLSQLDKSINWRLHIVGDGPEKENLMILAKKLYIFHRIVFHGYLSNLVPVLNQSDICFLTSLEYESCSNAILEYMSNGKPTIATTASGNPELIDNNVNGILVSIKDPNALGKAITRLIGSAKLRMKLGENALAKARKYYAMEVVAKKYEDVYLSVLNHDDDCKRDCVE